jgi:KDO2-lipid IV(A) lauroyltransferase
MFFSALSLLLSNLPRWLASAAFELLYPVYLIKFKKERDYIAKRLKKTSAQTTPREVHKNLFFNGLDSLRFLQNKKVDVKFENLDLLQNEIGKNAVVFASIHLGAFEMLHRGAAQFSGVLNLIVSEFKNKKLDAFLTKTRMAKNVKIARDYEVAKILKHAIRNKEAIAIMADQAKQGGEYFQILGDSVPLFLKLPLMANRLGASIVFYRSFKKNGSHIIRFERICKPQTEINKNEIAKMIESWILECPQQWAWNYGYSNFLHSS